MRLPVRIPQHHLGQKALAAGIIALLSAGLALGLWHAPHSSPFVERVDNLIYDSLYKLRPIDDRTNGSVVIVAVDQKSLDAMDAWQGFGWPWPREFWGVLVRYFDQCGAKAVAFDLLFTETSAYANEFNDDVTFAEAVKAARVPVVFPTLVNDDGERGPFALDLPEPLFGAVNIGETGVMRVYRPFVHGTPSLATQALLASEAIDTAPIMPFRLHYYGPNVDERGNSTFRYLSASSVIAKAMNDENADPALTPELFKDKIVLIGAITAGTYDLKSSPLAEFYPGVEVHATAIENLLHDQQVWPLGFAGTAGVTTLGALLASLMVLLPRRMWLKAAGGILVLAGVAGLGTGLFLRDQITWLPMASPLLAVVVASFSAFAWSYLTEDRQRRLILKAFSQYVSPAVADRIAQNPGRVTLGGERREMTVMFTDLQGFTNLTETMQVEELTQMLNFYLDEMSGVVLEHDGTVDKYIGDAIMSFWNAPVDQADHALLACRAALGMKRREEQLRPRLAGYTTATILTRIGLNTGPMAVGNMGSDRKINYTVLGDSVNLASRLEGANKFYGTQILIAQTTADLVRGQFAMREIDRLRVKGKQQPMAVYELLDTAPGDATTQLRIHHYEMALALYRSQQWDAAEKPLLDLLTHCPDDAPAKVLLDRVAAFRTDPPGAEWDGVYVAKDK